LASNRLLLYANADIIFFNDMMKAAAFVAHSQVSWRPFSPFFEKEYDEESFDFSNGPFLAVGRRWSLTVPELIDFDDPRGWESQIKKKLLEEGILKDGFWIDYFLFPQELNITLLPFIVGQPRWDSWFMHTVRSSGIPVVDITRVTTVIHMDHSRKWAFGTDIDIDMERMAGYYLKYANLERANFALDYCLQKVLCPYEYRFTKPHLSSMLTLRSGITILIFCTVVFIILLVYRCRCLPQRRKRPLGYVGRLISILDALIGVTIVTFLFILYIIWLDLGRAHDLFFNSLTSVMRSLTQSNLFL
jgi:hypothetical protein